MDKLFMLSDEQRELADKIQTPMHYVFAAIAIPLAVCNIIVFSQREMRSPSAVYVISLNAGQLFYVVSTTLDDIWAAFVAQPYSQYAHSVYRYYIAVYGGVFVAKRGSYAILVPSSVERLYAVLRPLHLKNFLLSKHPGLVVLCIYALSAILHVYFLTKSVVSVVSVVGELKDKEGEKSVTQ
nr:hypothetical protein BaRGS_013846 [Batillaria attramentaria]